MSDIQYLFPDTKYSEWFPLPEDRDTLIGGILENKRFQIRTDKKIDSTNNIRWLLKLGGLTWFTFERERINAENCKNGYRSFTGDEGFFERAGNLTFLKTTTQLQVWFDDVLEVTWVYVNKDSDKKCAMRNKLNGLKFRANLGDKADKVSTHYRYEIGDNLE